MEYVKNRRLQLACRDVLAGSAGVLDIALKYGYDSHEGFTRAFKAYFGTTPSEYRKRGKLNETEVVKMLSNEVLNRIGQNAEKISATLNNFIEEAEKLAIHAHKTAKAAGVNGTTTAIVANELGNLAKRVGNLKDELKSYFVAVDVSAFEMFEKLFSLIRCLDDVVFQMNLLRFFSGVETGRIAPPSELGEFANIDEGYAKLCGKIVGEKEHMIALMNEAIEQLHNDIKQEADNCMKSSVKAVNKAAEEGENTTTSAHTAAESLGERSRAFSHITKEVSISLIILKSVMDDFNNARNLSVALSQLANSTFGMNINAFNVAVETARAGNPAECMAAAEKIMNYAGVLQKTYCECETLCGEYERLTELTKRNNKQSEKAIAEKRVDDIIFQSGILSGQFALEAERINRDTFRSLAQTATTAHAKLVQERNVIKHRKAVTIFLQELNE